jgi:hypothetical protein
MEIYTAMDDDRSKQPWLMMSLMLLILYNMLPTGFTSYSA